MNSLTFLFLMFCRWNITIYTRKISPIVFWMKSLRFRRLAFAVTSRLCLILEIFGSTDLHCCCLGSQFGGPVSLKSPALMLLFCLVWLKWRGTKLFWQSMVRILLLKTNIPLTQNHSIEVGAFIGMSLESLLISSYCRL